MNADLSLVNIVLDIISLKLRHDDVIKWKHFPRYWPFAREIYRSPVNRPHKCQWRGALMFSLTCVWINSWVISHEAGDLRRYRAHYDVIIMMFSVNLLLLGLSFVELPPSKFILLLYCNYQIKPSLSSSVYSTPKYNSSLQEMVTSAQRPPISVYPITQ